MPNRILVLFIVITFNSKLTFGQQNPQFSQYIFNQIYYNPAVTGIGNTPKVQLFHRSQYIGYESTFDNGGSLTTQSLSFQMPLLKSNSGVGVVIVNDQAGIQKNQQFRLTYAKNFKYKQGVISIGGSAGMYNNSFGSGFRPRETNDPLIPAEGFSQIKPDFGIGVYYTAKSYFGGLSLNNLNNPKFDYGATNGKSEINRNLTLIAGLNLPVNKNLEIVPSILVRSDFQTNTYEGSILAKIGSSYWIGGSYRHQDAAIIMAGINLLKDKNLQLGMAYDLVTGLQKVKAASSVEIMASYAIGGGSKTIKPPFKSPIIRTPRYRH
jgi:type IX secretion system PorP/SprF family membrane protein